MTSIFGGGTSKASRESQAAQRSANLATERFIREQTARAREDVMGLFPAGEQIRGAGFQSALDVIGAGVSPQVEAFRQGNIGAQEITAAGLPQIQAALLGTPMQAIGAPRSISPDLSFLSGLTVPAEVREPAPVVDSNFNMRFPVPASRSAFDMIGSRGISRAGLNTPNRTLFGRGPMANRRLDVR